MLPIISHGFWARQNSYVSLTRTRESSRRHRCLTKRARMTTEQHMTRRDNTHVLTNAARYNALTPNRSDDGRERAVLASTSLSRPNSVGGLVVLTADEVVERRDLPGEQASELLIPVDGVSQVDLKRREVDLEGRKLVV